MVIKFSSRYYFYCDNNPKLKNLVGGPKQIDYLSINFCENIESLDGFPDKVFISFYHTGCPKLPDSEIEKYRKKWY